MEGLSIEPESSPQGHWDVLAMAMTQFSQSMNIKFSQQKAVFVSGQLRMVAGRTSVHFKAKDVIKMLSKCIMALRILGKNKILLDYACAFSDFRAEGVDVTHICRSRNAKEGTGPPPIEVGGLPLARLSLECSRESLGRSRISTDRCNWSILRGVLRSATDGPYKHEMAQ